MRSKTKVLVLSFALFFIMALPAVAGCIFEQYGIVYVVTSNGEKSLYVKDAESVFKSSSCTVTAYGETSSGDLAPISTSSGPCGGPCA